VAKLTWDDVSKRFYETGVDRGVLFVDNTGVPWNGLVSVEESPSGGEAKPSYIDGVKYLNRSAREEFEATLSAFFSPVEFDQCEGTGSLSLGLTAGQQRRKDFGLSYRTKLGNDVLGNEYGYKIHLIYNARVAPTTRNYTSLSDSVEVPALSWPITTKPVVVPGMARSAHITIDSTKVSRLGLEEVEKALYGTDIDAPYLPTPQQLLEMLNTADVFTVTDLGGGLFRISGRNENIITASPDVYEITHPTAVVLVPNGADISTA
jgi:hypothetical protein